MVVGNSRRYSREVSRLAVIMLFTQATMSNSRGYAERIDSQVRGYAEQQGKAKEQRGKAKTINKILPEVPAPQVYTTPKP